MAQHPPTARRWILAAGLSLAGLSLVVPPWVFVDRFGREIDHGYRLILNLEYPINLVRLAVQLAGIGALTAAVYFTFGRNSLRAGEAKGEPTQ